MSGKIVRSTNGDFYSAAGGETLRDIAAETGVDYEKLKTLNPTYGTSRIGVGRKILLEASASQKKAEQKESEAAAKTAAAAAASEAKAKEKAEKAAEQARIKAAKAAAAAIEKARQKQIKADGYNAEILNAEQSYAENLSEAENDYNDKIYKLASALESRREKSEVNFANQKITASSIADNYNASLDSAAEREKAVAERDYNAEKEKLKTKLEQVTDANRRKIAAL